MKPRKPKEHNPDGVSLKGCSYIYPPKGQAGEYAPLAANPYRGCGHGCAYCYVPEKVIRTLKRPEFDAGAVPRKDFLRALVKDARHYQAAGITEQVMLSFTSDPYHPGDTTLPRETLIALIEHGMAICTLSKGGTRALRDIDLFRPDRDAYAATLTSLDDRFSLRWERHAPLPGDRIAALRAFHEKGIFTWVSLEPTLSIEASLTIVRATHGFVDLYKVGRANYCADLTKTTDWRGYTLQVIELLTALGKRHYIKKKTSSAICRPVMTTPCGYHSTTEQKRIETMIIGREKPDNDGSIENAVEGQPVYVHHNVDDKPTIFAHLSETERGPFYVAVLDSEDVDKLISTALAQQSPMREQLLLKLRALLA